MSAPSPSQRERIDRLREEVRAIVGEGSQAQTDSLSFGISTLDEKLASAGLRRDALHEIAGASPSVSDDAAATLFIAGIAARTGGHILWVARRRDLFAPGLAQAGIAPERLIHVEAQTDADLLDIMEEGLRHRGLGAVIGEVKRAGMAAARRLQLAAEGGGTIALLLRRHGKDPDPLSAPSAAVTRWRIATAPSAPLPCDGVGRARWIVSLVRQRGGEPHSLILEACDETGRCALPARMADRTVVADGAITRAAA